MNFCLGRACRHRQHREIGMALVTHTERERKEARVAKEGLVLEFLIRAGNRPQSLPGSFAFMKHFPNPCCQPRLRRVCLMEFAVRCNSDCCCCCWRYCPSVESKWRRAHRSTIVKCIPQQADEFSTDSFFSLFSTSFVETIGSLIDWFNYYNEGRSNRSPSHLSNINE